MASTAPAKQRFDHKTDRELLHDLTKRLRALNLPLPSSRILRRYSRQQLIQRHRAVEAEDAKRKKEAALHEEKRKRYEAEGAAPLNKLPRELKDLIVDHLARSAPGPGCPKHLGSRIGRLASIDREFQQCVRRRLFARSSLPTHFSSAQYEIYNTVAEFTFPFVQELHRAQYTLNGPLAAANAKSRLYLEGSPTLLSNMHTLVIKPADGRKPREDEEITLYPLTDFPSLNVLVYEGCHWAPTSFFGVASGCSNTAIRTIKLHDMRFDDVPVEALVALGELAQLETLHLDGYLRGWPHCVVAQHEGNMEQMRHSLQAVVGKMATDIACNLFSSLKHLSLGGFDPGHYITDFFLSRCSRNLRTLEITGTLDLIPSATSVTMPFAFNDPRRVGSMMDRRPTGVDLINLERVKLGNVREVARLVKWLSPTPVRDLGITCTVSNSPTVSIELTMVNETIRGIEADWFDKRAGGFAELKRMQWTALPQENEFYFPAYLDLLGEDEQEEQERDRGRFHSLVQIGSNAREVLSQRLTEEGVAIEVVPLTDKRDAKKRWNATWDLDAQ